MGTLACYFCLFQWDAALIKNGSVMMVVIVGDLVGPGHTASSE